MSDEEETVRKRVEESESDESDVEIDDDVPLIDIDPSTLTPLSPEVISKQVRIYVVCYVFADPRLLVRRRRRSWW